jgi:hypothetical protein
MFREIPAGSMFFGAGSHWRGSNSNGNLCGSGHANSRFLCKQHDHLRRRLEAVAETTVHLLYTTPLLLPPDQFCGVCARLVVNQNNGLETEQVATVCCGFMCAHCAAEHFITSLQHGMHCNICSKEVRGWTVRQQDGGADRRVEAAAPTLWRQHPQLRNRPVHVERGRVEMQLLYYAVDDQPPETMSSVFSVYDGEEKMRTGGARSALMQLARLLHLQMRNNPPIEIECGTEGEFDNARDASRRLFLNMFVLNLVTGLGALPDRKTMRRNNYAIRRSNAIFVISEMIHRATNLRYQGALSSYVLALHATPELKARGDGLAKLCLTSNGAGKNRVRDEAVKTSWIKNGGSDTVDAILDLESGGLVMGMVDNMGNRRSAKDGNGFVQKTLGMFRVTSRDALRFAGGPHRNLLMRDAMVEKDVSTVEVSLLCLGMFAYVYTYIRIYLLQSRLQTLKISIHMAQKSP